jgi:hypothetical protein
VADLRPQTQPLHDAGPKAFDQHIGLFDQPQGGFSTVRGFDVQPDQLPPRLGMFLWAANRLESGGAGLAVDLHHLRAQIGKDHTGKRHRP